jgi:signal transduction histidine kinase
MDDETSSPGTGTFDLSDDVTEVLLERARVSALQAEVGLALATSGDEGEGLCRCAAAVVDLLGTALCEVWLAEPEHEDLRVVARAGEAPGERDTVRMGDLRVGLIASSRRSHHTNSVLGDPQVDGAWARREGMVAFAGVPLVVDDRAIGAVTTFSRRPISDIAADGLEPIGNALAQFVERKRTEALLRESLDQLHRGDDERRRLLTHLVKAQEDERERIAADIHDDSVQVLTAVSIRLHSLRRKLGRAGADAGIEQLETLVHAAIDRLRSLLFELTPPELGRNGLRAALVGRLAQLSAERSIETMLDHRLAVEPQRPVALVAHRVVQEALTNVRKHSGAKRVWVSVEDAGEGLLVRVADDGRGFRGPVDDDPGWDGPGKRHFGIDVMRQRTEAAGGWFRLVGSGEHGGAEVEFWLPLEPPPT